MYHDALQSGLKAFGFDRGVTVQGGLPVPITTPAHGTAFDIAGKNEANLEPTLNSFKIALTMAENKLNELKLKISKLLFINGRVKLYLLKVTFVLTLLMYCMKNQMQWDLLDFMNGWYVKLKLRMEL